jgi:hypothetical protein
MNEMSQLKAATVQLHELFLELQNAGFKRREALYIIAVMLGHGQAEND